MSLALIIRRYTNVLFTLLLDGIAELHVSLAAVSISNYLLTLTYTTSCIAVNPSQ